MRLIGTATGIDNFISTIKPIKRATVLGLATVITLAAMGATLMSCQPGSAVRQLLEARECQSLDFKASCQQKTGN